MAWNAHLGGGGGVGKTWRYLVPYQGITGISALTETKGCGGKNNISHLLNRIYCMDIKW